MTKLRSGQSFLYCGVGYDNTVIEISNSQSHSVCGGGLEIHYKRGLFNGIHNGY